MLMDRYNTRTTREIRVKRQCFTGRTAVRPDQGFTLIELLIVIAIIALLAGLLLPALSGARQRGLSAVCISQMHQLQIAFQMYAHDNQDVVPKCSGESFQGQTPEKPSWCAGTMGYETGTNPNILHSDATNTWLIINAPYGSIGPYTQNAKLYHCPGDTSYIELGGKRHLRVRSYAQNQRVGFSHIYGDPEWRGFSFHTTLQRLAEVGASRIIVYGEPHEDDLTGDFFFVGDLPNQWVFGDLKWGTPPTSRHNRRGSFSFADGHVEMHRWLDPRTCQPGRRMFQYGYVFGEGSNVDIKWMNDHVAVPLFQ